MKSTPEELRQRKRERKRRYRQNFTEEQKEISKEYQRQYYLKNIDDIKKQREERKQGIQLKNKIQKVFNE